jgi:hypothetical protein
VGGPAETQADAAAWGDLARRVEGGSTALCLSPTAFRKGDDPVGWLPLANRGRFYEFNDWLYHKECVSARHPIFEGLPRPGIMDWDYYGPVVSRGLFEGQDTPDETAVAAFAIGYPVDGGYASGIMVGCWSLGRGVLVLNTLNVLDNIDRHPAADRLLLNLTAYGAARLR